VDGPVSSQALVNVDSDPSTNEWSIGLSINNPSPFKMSQHLTTFSDGLQERVVNGSDVLVDGIGCSSNSQSCSQSQRMSFNGCDSLSGNVTFTYNVVCNVPSPDCVPPSDQVSVTVGLHTGTGCPVTHTVSFTSTTLASYSDPELETPQSDFNDDQTAYFGAYISSNEVTITSFDISSVCLQLENENGSCVPVTFQSLPPTSGFNPVFSVDLSQSTSISAQSGKTFSVQSVIGVFFEGEQKRSVFTQQVGIHSSIQLKSTTSPSQRETPASVKSSSASTIYIAVIAVLGGVVVLGGVIGVVVYLKKKSVTSV